MKGAKIKSQWKKGIALKASSSIQEEIDIEDSIDLDEDEDLSLFIKRFNKFIRKRENKRGRKKKNNERNEKRKTCLL